MCSSDMDYDEMDIDDIKAEIKHMIDEDLERFVGQEKTISSDK